MGRNRLIERFYIGSDGKVSWTAIGMTYGFVLTTIIIAKWLRGDNIDIGILEWSSVIIPVLFALRPVQKGVGGFVSRMVGNKDPSPVAVSLTTPIAPPHKKAPSKVKVVADPKLRFPLTIESLTCKDGTPVPENLRENAERLLKNVEVIWRETGRGKIKVTSGYRTPAWNKLQKGSKKSKHMKAMAIDFLIAGLTKAKLRDLIILLMDEGKIDAGGVGIGVSKNFCHYDISGVKHIIKY